MTRHIFISLFFFYLTSKVISQKQGNIWYFGDHAGLDFNSGSPVALTNGAIYNGSLESEGTSAMSDNNGSLLFYTNGEKAWNRFHQVMLHGDSLMGNYSSTQAALIVPQPGSSRYYYLFTTDCFQNKLANGFRYSLVDMCLDNGNGDVVSGSKNIKLLDTVAEKITAVRHANGNDYWIVVHKYYSDAFYAYLLTASGITNTVISHTGSVHTGYCINTAISTVNGMGSMKASPSGSKIAIVSGQQCNNISELFDFNKNTGTLSNMIRLRTDSLAVGLYGVSFSPDNSKLYITSWMNHDRIYQYDLSANTATAIVASKTVIATNNGGPFFMGMQLGPDGKIYVVRRGQSHMGCITLPNLTGNSCMYVDTAVWLGGKKNVLGITNFIDFFDYSNGSTGCAATGLDDNNSFPAVSIFPNPFNGELTLAGEMDFYQMRLRDGQGTEVFSVDVKNGRLNLNHLPPGIYYYQLSDGNGNVLKCGKICRE